MLCSATPWQTGLPHKDHRSYGTAACTQSNIMPPATIYLSWFWWLYILMENESHNHYSPSRCNKKSTDLLFVSILMTRICSTTFALQVLCCLFLLLAHPSWTVFWEFEDEKKIGILSEFCDDSSTSTSTSTSASSSFCFYSCLFSLLILIILPINHSINPGLNNDCGQYALRM